MVTIILTILSVLFSLTACQTPTPTKIEVVALHSPPFVTYNESNDPQYSGFSIDILNEVIKRLNSQKIAVIVSYNKITTSTRNWDEAAKEVIEKNKTGNWLVGDFILNGDRFSQLDAVYPYMDDSFSILVKSNSEELDMWNFLRPFDTELWWAIIGYALAFSVLNWLGDYITPYGIAQERKRIRDWNLKNKDKPKDQLDPHTFADACDGAMMTLLDREPEERTRSWGLRIMKWAFMFFSVTIVAYYTGALTSFFTTRAVGKPDVAGFSDLLSYSFGVIDGSGVENYFYHQYYAVWLNIERYENLTEMFAALDSNRISAFVHTTAHISYILQNISRKGKYITVGEPFNKFSYVFGLEPWYPVTHNQIFHALNSATLQLREDGFITETRKKYWKDEKLEKLEPPGGQSLELNTFHGVFALTGILIAFGILLLLIENLFFRCTQDKVPDLIDKDDRSFAENALVAIDSFFGGSHKDSRKSPEDKVTKMSNLISSNDDDDGNVPPSSEENYKKMTDNKQ